MRAKMSAMETPVQSPAAPLGDAVTVAPSAPVAVPALTSSQKELKSESKAPVAEAAKAFSEQKREAKPETKAEVQAGEASRQATPMAPLVAAPAQIGELAAKKSDRSSDVRSSGSACCRCWSSCTFCFTH